MELVDTHCHIQSIGSSIGERHTRELWAKNNELTRKSVVTNAQTAGVSRLIVVGCDLDDSKLACDFVENENNTWASIGIHPHEAKIFANDKEKKQQFAELIKRDKVIAIGECGLDYYYNHSDKEDQLEMLRYQIELATLNKLPIVFHVRDAFTDFWPMFNTFSGVRGVLHSFTDSIENLNIAVSKNLMIGVNGIATFAKQAEQISMYKTIPLENLVLETDAPYLTPIPHRGSINEPKYIKDIAVFMAKLKETTIEEVAKHTTRNAMKLFGMN